MDKMPTASDLDVKPERTYNLYKHRGYRSQGTTNQTSG